MPPFDKNGLYFIPLGGSEQFGVNLNVYACDGELLVVDCGLGFADEHYPGIDLLLPDPKFLEENRDAIRGMIITHAHEDHIGAVAYLWERFECPLYASPFTAAVLQKKLQEAGYRGVPIHIATPQKNSKIGPFNVQYVPVAHSIPDAYALIIDSPHGRVVHSGDWNLDPAPVIGMPTDPAPFIAAGDAGVLAYVGDSTNANAAGEAGSESAVEHGLEAEFRTCSGRVIVTIFASNVARIMSISRAASRCGREVAILGRSLFRMTGIARNCGYMDDIPAFVEEDDLHDIADENLVIIMTGSQGEYRAALARVARGDDRNMRFHRTDSVIFSSRAIPGNEKAINAVKNNLSAMGIRIITPKQTDNLIHVSGHPCADEITEMIEWVRPQCVIPVHGERTQLDAQARLATDLGIKNVVVPVNGAVIKLSGGPAKIIDNVETGLLAVDQKRIVAADHQSIVGRRKLQYSGAVHVSIALDAKGKIIGKPRMDTLGLFDEEDAAERRLQNRLLDEIHDVLDDMHKDDLTDDHFIAEELRIALRRFVFHNLGIKPKTTVHVIRV